jgi:hypothetical protein
MKQLEFDYVVIGRGTTERLPLARFRGYRSLLFILS